MVIGCYSWLLVVVVSCQSLWLLVIVVTTIIMLLVIGAAPSMAKETTSAEPASGAKKPPLQDPRYWSPGHMGGVGNMYGAGNTCSFLRWHCKASTGASLRIEYCT